jgi:Tfp pilus assembly protein PilO
LAKLTDNQKTMVILGSGALLALGAGAMIYVDLGARDEVLLKIDEQKALKTTNDGEIKKIQPLTQELVAFKKIVTDNAKILPTDADINNFFRDLANMEKEAGISIRTLPAYNPTLDKNLPLVSRFPMKMQLTASTRAFLRFLNQIESRERLVSISEFRIAPASESQKPGAEIEHDISVSFDLYRYDPKGGPTGKFPVGTADELRLLETKEVKDLVASKGRPQNLEQYRLLQGREGRPDPFLDPRRRTGKVGPAADTDDTRSREELLLESLRFKLEKLRLELEGYRNAEQSKDFLRMAAAKRNLQKATGDIEEEIRKVSANNPEFKSRDIQDRYLVEVKRPYEKLMQEIGAIVDRGGRPGGPIISLTEVMAAGIRKDMQDLFDRRAFKECFEKWNSVEALEREATASKSVEEGAKPHLDAMRAMGVRSRHQQMLEEKKFNLQGVMRMETGSAVIVNGKAVRENRNVDKDVVFVRVVAGKDRSDPDRLIFKVQGQEVDWIPPKPEILTKEKALEMLE